MYLPFLCSSFVTAECVGAIDVSTPVLALWHYSPAIPGRGCGNSWGRFWVWYLVAEVMTAEMMVLCSLCKVLSGGQWTSGYFSVQDWLFIGVPSSVDAQRGAGGRDQLWCEEPPAGGKTLGSWMCLKRLLQRASLHDVFVILQGVNALVFGCVQEMEPWVSTEHGFVVFTLGSMVSSLPEEITAVFIEAFRRIPQKVRGCLPSRSIFFINLNWLCWLNYEMLNKRLNRLPNCLRDQVYTRVLFMF